jgi:hypothetical protein
MVGVLACGIQQQNHKMSTAKKMLIENATCPKKQHQQTGWRTATALFVWGLGKVSTEHVFLHIFWKFVNCLCICCLHFGVSAKFLQESRSNPYIHKHPDVQRSATPLTWAGA